MDYLTEKAKKALTSRGNSFIFDAIMGLTNSVDCGDGVATGGGIENFWLIKELGRLSNLQKLTLISDLAIQARRNMEEEAGTEPETGDYITVITRVEK